MSSVLDRPALEESPLADLHLIANQIGVDGYRRLRKADLIDAILAKQSGEEPAGAADADADADADAPAEERPRRGRSRGGRSRTARPSGDDETAEAEEAAARAEEEPEDEAPARGRRSRGGRGRGREGGREGGRDRDESRDRDRDRDAEERTVEGPVELMGNGSGFVRVTPGETSDDDVYISAAQVKRCELVSGDTVSGPVRAPRRSERYPSLVRVDTINGTPADEVSEGTRFEDLPAAFPAERLELGSDDPTVQAIEWLTPFGKGSRVTVCGPARSGKSEVLRKLAALLAQREGLEVSVVLAGARPEEVGEWTEPAACAPFGTAPESQGQAVEKAVEQARRVAARGGDAVVIVDSLEYVSGAVARRTLAAARNIPDGGSLTVIAAAPAPFGGETTVIALDATLVALRRFPALDLHSSGSIRPELLVGDAGAEAIAKARAETYAAA